MEKRLTSLATTSLSFETFSLENPVMWVIVSLCLCLWCKPVHSIVRPHPSCWAVTAIKFVQFPLRLFLRLAFGWVQLCGAGWLKWSWEEWGDCVKGQNLTRDFFCQPSGLSFNNASGMFFYVYQYLGAMCASASVCGGTGGEDRSRNHCLHPWLQQICQAFPQGEDRWDA